MSYGFIDDIGDIIEIFYRECINSTKEETSMYRRSPPSPLLRAITSKRLIGNEKVFNTPICKSTFQN